MSSSISSSGFAVDRTSQNSLGYSEAEGLEGAMVEVVWEEWWTPWRLFHFSPSLRTWDGRDHHTLCPSEKQIRSQRRDRGHGAALDAPWPRAGVLRTGKTWVHRFLVGPRSCYHASLQGSSVTKRLRKAEHYSKQKIKTILTRLLHQQMFSPTGRIQPQLREAKGISVPWVVTNF